ncbi:MAG TPA: TRAP transporter large permease subunit [Geminicoccaceae bacterium]|nr:TRAP transporter large permease subunit [Geminicoccaceae bacterium]
MSDGGLAGLMFPALFVLVLLGIPVSFGLMAVSFGFGFLFFGAATPIQLYGRLVEVAQGFVFAAVPMFVLMGTILERSGLAERLFAALQLWLGRLPGGLALAVMAMGAIFAAASGIIGAVEVVIGLMAIPVMLERGYDRGLIAGTITSAGSLGTIIPPSVLCVVFGSIAQLPIGDLFAGCLLPGLVMVALFQAYILIRCRLRPMDGPPAAGPTMPLGRRLRRTATGLLPPLLLIVAVLGSILAGVASPTEAAAVGALGAALLALANRRLGMDVLLQALRATLRITSFIMLIVLGGTLFSSVFYVLGGGRLVHALIDHAGLSATGTVLLFLAIVFLAGFVLDWATVVLVAVPIFMPVLRTMGVDPLWFAILMIVVLQTSYLTPPMAPAIFYLRSIAPPSIGYGDMVRGVLPFILCQALTVALVWFLPPLATALPRRLAGF